MKYKTTLNKQIRFDLITLKIKRENLVIYISKVFTYIPDQIF